MNIQYRQNGPYEFEFFGEDETTIATAKRRGSNSEQPYWMEVRVPATEGNGTLFIGTVNTLHDAHRLVV